MRWNRTVCWSPVEEDYLKENRDTLPINQLTIDLSKSRNAITRKLAEFDGKPMPAKKNKKSYIGKRPDLGISCRSAWEANILRYFNYIGWKWLYEPHIFTFEKERRGAISYLPDVYLPEYDTWIEIKGHIDSKSRGAIRKMKKYYPEEFPKLKAITGNPKTKASEFFNKLGVPILFYYSNINKQYKSTIDHWE